MTCAPIAYLLGLDAHDYLLIFCGVGTSVQPSPTTSGRPGQAKAGQELEGEGEGGGGPAD